MSWKYIEYEYPSPNLLQKVLAWADKNFNCYVAAKLNSTDAWTYYAGNVSHSLTAGLKLTNYGSVEGDAQANYLTTVKDATGKVLMVLPSNLQMKYVRLYIEVGSSVTIYEFRPSTYFTAHEIIAGTLEISDELAETPSIKVTAASQERLLMGKLDTAIYGLRGKDASGKVTFEIRTDNDKPYIGGYADHRAIELEMMKMSFQSISWAQFAIYDAFDDETRRADPDLSTYPAVVEKSSLTNGGDTTADRAFGFISKVYSDITTVYSGNSSAVGTNYLTDALKNWFVGECKNLTLTDSAATDFNVEDNNNISLVVAGTPTAGAYSLKTVLPAYAVAFCSYEDSTNGGYGYVTMEVSFDGGSNWQTFLDNNPGTTIDCLEGTTEIAHPGTAYMIRLTLKNDGAGQGPVVYKALVCTDPSVWRF